MYRSYKDQGLVLLGIHCDTWNDAVSVAQSEGIEYPITNDVNGATQKAYGVPGYPTIYVVDKQGVLRSIDPSDLGATVKELLAE